MSELLNEVNKFELDEGFSPREIKMAIGIASDPRYKGGNMTGATNAIDKIKKGLSDHPKVAAVLRRQNEEVKEKEEGFSSDAQRRAAFASGYKEKGKKKKDEAVSPAQQAAIAISKKEKGEKPKDEKDEGNEFGMALKTARNKGEKTFVVSGKKYNVTEEESIDIENESEYTLDESKMKELAMKIADVYMQMKKDSVMKPFADRFRADVKRSLDIRKSLEKVLPDYVDGAKITAMMKEEETDEAMSPKAKAAAAAKARQDKKFGPGGSYSKGADAIRKVLAKKEDVEVTEGYFDEQKSSTGYDLYHKEFSGAMQHAYAHAKKKFGITIDPDEISDKVSTGPRKPSKGKTNSYRLKGDRGSVQIQVYNMGSRYELNMYKESIDEEVELEEGTTKVPTSMADFRGIMNIMKRPIKAKDAGKAISKYIDDDYLANGIISINTKDPNADARPAIMRGFNKLEISTMGEPSYGSQIKFNRNFEISDKRQKTLLQRSSSEDKNNMTRITLRGGAKVRAEEVELDEITNKFAVVSVKSGDVLAFASDEKDAISLSKNNLRKEKGKVVKLKRGIATNRASKMIGRPLEMGMAEEVENKELDEGKKKPVSQMTPKEKAADAARRKEYKDYQKSKREEVENEELDEAQIAALTKANIKHTVKQHPMKRSKTMVNVSRKDYKAAEKALGKEASSQSDNIMLGISESVKLGGMPAGLSKERIKADRDVYAQVLGIKEALDPADFDISATDKDIS